MLSKGALNGRPILREHTGSAVGKCLTSWQSRDGSLCIEANVDDESVKKEIRTGKLRGLSLGTDCLHIDEGNVHKDQREISVCEEGRRSQTWIFEINGKRRHRFQPAQDSVRRVVATRRPPPAARHPPPSLTCHTTTTLRWHYPRYRCASALGCIWPCHASSCNEGTHAQKQ